MDQSPEGSELDGGGGTAAVLAPRPPVLRRRRRRLRFASPGRGPFSAGRRDSGWSRLVRRGGKIGLGRLGGCARCAFGLGVVGRAGRLFLCSRRVFRRAFGAPALAPFVGVSGRDRCLLDRAPVECDVGILFFESAAHLGIERRAANLDVGRGAKPVEDARAHLAATVRGRVHERETLDAALVARESEERQLTSSFSWGRSSSPSRPSAWTRPSASPLPSLSRAWPSARVWLLALPPL